MKKLTAGIFTVLIGLCAANSADASVASTGWVEEQVGALASTVGTNKTEAANATKAVSDALTEYKTSNDAAVALKANQTSLDATNALVGTLPQGVTATTIVGYIQEKTSGIATDAALGELQTQVSGNASAISTLNGSGEGSVAKSISDALASYTNTTDMQAAIKVVSDALGAHESAAASTYQQLSNIHTDSAVKLEGEALNTKYPSVGYVDAKVSSIDTDLGGVKNSIAQNVELIGANADAIDDLEALVEANENDVEGKVSAINTKIGAVAEGKDVVAMISDAQTAAEAKVTALENGQVKANEEAIAAIDEELDTMATSETVTALTNRVGANETNIAANSTNITKNAENILANAKDIEAHTKAIAAAQAQADKGVADAAAAQATANAAKTTADAAIPKPTGECSNADNKCVLTYNNSTYTWEVIERSADGE